MNKKFLAFFLLIIFLGAVIVNASDGKEIYIAGIPDAYPIEAYENSKGCYVGIIPDILEETEKRTGIHFVYVQPGDQDQRLEFAANSQIEMFCSLGLGATDLGKIATWQEYKLEGDGSRKYIPVIRMMFTNIMDAQTAEHLRLTWSEMAEDGALQRIYDNYSTQYLNEDGKSDILVKGIILTTFLFLLVSICMSLSLRKRGKEIQSIKHIDKLTGGITFESWKNRCNELVRAENRWHYTVVQVTAGMEQIDRVYGYKEGEDVLKILADVLENHLDTDKECFTRFHELQYVLLLQYTRPENISERIGKIFLETEEIFQQKQKKYFVNLHAGVYSFENVTNTLEEAIQYSEVAMGYAVSQEIPISFYNEKVERNTISDYVMEHEAIHGLMNREFIMFLQPILDGGTELIVGAQTLVRWQSPSRGLLKPEEFLEVMNRKQLTARMNFDIFEQGCQLIQKENSRGRFIRLMFNFSQDNMLDKSFADRLWEIACQYEVGENQVIIQMNQLKRIAHYSEFSQTIHRLRDYGFDVCAGSIDMGRTFYEALNSGVTAVKLGPDLIGNLDDEKVQIIVKNLIGMCKELKLQVFCVGVETGHQAEFLKELECELVEGFFYYRPVSQQIFTALMDETSNLSH